LLLTHFRPRRFIAAGKIVTDSPALRRGGKPKDRLWPAWLSLLLLAASLQASPAPAPLFPPGTNALRLRDFLQLVLERNESLQQRVIEFEISRKKYKGEKGVFEPELVASYDRVENERENTAEQRRSTGEQFFKEKNNIYEGGLESLVPSGARVRLGYTLRNLDNNLQDPPLGVISTNAGRGEYQTFVGLSVTQPLLKNGWYPATMANIRLAALASEVAFQDYRKQLMTVVSSAEASYWNLHMSQQQVRFFEDSVALADGLVRDNRARLQAGRGSELEVLEAESGLALRQSKLNEARQKFQETVAQLRTLLALPPAGAGVWLQAADQPGLDAFPSPEFLASGETAFAFNPDYLGQKSRVQSERVRLAYAKNQRLPQLDLRASYGLNGLGDTPADSWSDVEHGDFPSFSAGVELRLPLGGGIRSRHELSAARLRQFQALGALKEIETQMLNALDTALLKVRSTREAITNYLSVADFNRNLLETQLARLEAGRVDSRKVLESEAALFEARNAVVEARVQHERAWLELELVQGSILRSRGVDLHQAELETRTETLFRGAGYSAGQFQGFLKDLKLTYERKDASAGLPPPRRLSDDDYEKALRLLREHTAPGAPPKR
jgi:outer membrane protein TolC